MVQAARVHPETNDLSLVSFSRVIDDYKFLVDCKIKVVEDAEYARTHYEFTNKVKASV
jgi:hypothetical protein